MTAAEEIGYSSIDKDFHANGRGVTLPTMTCFYEINFCQVYFNTQTITE
jgi:hypothetical protein